MSDSVLRGPASASPGLSAPGREPRSRGPGGTERGGGGLGRCRERVQERAQVCAEGPHRGNEARILPRGFALNGIGETRRAAWRRRVLCRRAGGRVFPRRAPSGRARSRRRKATARLPRPRRRERPRCRERRGHRALRESAPPRRRRGLPPSRCRRRRRLRARDPGMRRILPFRLRTSDGRRRRRYLCAHGCVPPRRRIPSLRPRRSESRPRACGRRPDRAAKESLRPARRGRRSCSARARLWGGPSESERCRRAVPDAGPSRRARRRSIHAEEIAVG